MITMITHDFSLQLSGEKLFQFRDEEVDFYLPQIVNLYVNMREVAEVLHPYLIGR